MACHGGPLSSRCFAFQMFFFDFLSYTKKHRHESIDVFGKPSDPSLTEQYAEPRIGICIYITAFTISLGYAKFRSTYTVLGFVQGDIILCTMVSHHLGEYVLLFQAS